MFVHLESLHGKRKARFSHQHGGVVWGKPRQIIALTCYFFTSNAVDWLISHPWEEILIPCTLLERGDHIQVCLAQ